MKKVTSLVFVVFALVTASAAYTQNVPLERLMEYLEIDTINPPGNESRGVTFFQRIFEEAGIEIPFPQSDVNLRVIDVPKNQIEGAIAKTAPKAKKTKAPARVKKHNPNTTQPG